MASLEAADRYFSEKSYSHAAEQYAALLEAARVPKPQIPEVRLRLGECYARMEKWDQAVRHALSFAVEYRGTEWAPAGLHWLGRLFVGLPDSAQREVYTAPDGSRSAGPLLFSGEAVTPAENAELVWVHCAEQKPANALAALEAALHHLGAVPSVRRPGGGADPPGLRPGAGAAAVPAGVVRHRRVAHR
ncbi:MAG: hypothetical protein K0Q72_245 [Armatimonadetes bacterium]|jgi:hypothetical protein|nr:hypothetical protein [Armatimonadota bacterium]